MCNLYQMTPKGTAERAIGALGRQLLGDDWESRTVGPFQAGAFLVPAADGDLRACTTSEQTRAALGGNRRQEKARAWRAQSESVSIS